MRVLFCGTPEFAAVIFERLLASLHTVAGVVSQPARPQGRGLRSEDPPVVARARDAGVPVIQTPRLHARETLDELRALSPDLLVTAAFGRILKPPLLELPPRGCWNVHAGLLPRHRGASPVTAAVLAGDAWTGVSVFRMDAGIDTGPVLLQEMTAIGGEETAGELTARLAHLGGRLLIEALDREEQGTLRAVPQGEWGATYAPTLTKEDGRIPWDRPADQIQRLVRAVSPWPGAYTLLSGRRLRVHRLRPIHLLPVPDPADPSRTARPGTVVDLDGGIGVACRPGLALLCEVQSEGKKRTEAREWLRGNRIAPGTILDPDR